ncbi:hypothetical protein FAI41_05610 [Acetobacteraceae bacterium]|nr:hypothetical protein FAI41_05610 [Acetobacteraceae bacterium]
MKPTKIKNIFALFSGFFAVSALQIMPAAAHSNKDPALAPSPDWQRAAEVLISAGLENPGAVHFMPQTPIQTSFALENKAWQGWLANIPVQRQDLATAPIVNYACALSTVKKVPEKKLFGNYLVPASKTDFYTLASQDWLKKQAFNHFCGVDGKKCMFDNDKLAATLKAENLAANPDTSVRGKAMGQPETWIVCAAGQLRH